MAKDASTSIGALEHTAARKNAIYFDCKRVALAPHMPLSSSSLLLIIGCDVLSHNETTTEIMIWKHLRVLLKAIVVGELRA